VKKKILGNKERRKEGRRLLLYDFSVLIDSPLPSQKRKKKNEETKTRNKNWKTKFLGR
jgi:hypothetical protein